jgi:large repetitive protein
MKTLLTLAFASMALAQTITTSSPLPTGTLNQSYSTTLSCSNCQGLNYGLVSGSLPTGLNIDTGGTISGIPSAVGTYQFNVGLYSNNPSLENQLLTQKTFSINIPSALSILSTSFPNGGVGAVYSQNLTASGGVTPYTWSITSGALPPGLGILNNTTIGGTPTTAGTYAFTLNVLDSQGHGAFTQTSITIAAGTGGPVITTTTLPSGAVNVAYNTQLACLNCTGYTWSLSSGILPLGLSLSAGGAITGTPTSAGTSSFQVTVSAPTQTFSAGGGASAASQGYSLTINASTLGIAQTTIPFGFTATPYSTTLTPTGGQAPYTWSLPQSTTGNDGLSIGASTGTLAGTPTANGTFIINVMVNDSSGLTVTKQFTFTVSTGLSILTTSLPNGTIGTVYPTQTLSAGGGQPPYRWAATTGTLPPGLTLDPVFGRISGTPTAPSGAYPFTLTVTDNQANTATGSLSITITSGVTITISPSTLPAGTVGTAYSQALTASGGKAPYTFSATAGTLPAGLTLSAAGAITGTPTAAATSSFTVTATDSNQATGQQALSIVIAAAPPSPLTITTTSLPNGTVGTAYPQQTLTATGGVAPYTWALTSGTLPAGLTFNAGVIGGTPTAAATSSLTVQVTDSAKNTATKTLGIIIAAATPPVPTLTISSPTLPPGTVGVAYTQAGPVATGGTPPYTYTLTSTNNLGLSISKSGVISGTPTAAGEVLLNVVVTDSGTPPQTAFVSLLFTALSPAPPTAPTVTLSQVSGPASGFQQQPAFAPTISAAYPTAITGTTVLTFAPSVTPPAGSTGTIDDNMIQFSGGGRTATFTIPAGSTTAGNLTVLTGTTAGTITLTTTLTSNGATLGSPSVQTIVNAPGVPFISKVTLEQVSGGVTVVITGFSSTRDMVNASFAFAPATGDTFTSDNVSVPVQTPFATWYANTAVANAYGTQFTLTVPFTLATATQSVTSVAVVSVTVTLQNSKGASNTITLSN